MQAASDDDPEFKRLTSQGGADQLVKDLIREYQDEFTQQYGRTVGDDLELLARSDLAEMPIGRLRSGDIVSHIQRRLEDGVEPSTAGNDLTRLKGVVK